MWLAIVCSVSCIYVVHRERWTAAERWVEQEHMGRGTPGASVWSITLDACACDTVRMYDALL